MEYNYLRDIKLADNISQRVFAIFLIKSIELLDNKNGSDKYLRMTIQDKDISTELHKWNATDSDIERLQVGKVYCGAIDVKPYAKSSLGYSCALYNYEELDEDPSKFINWADGIDEAHYIIQTALSIISNSVYNKLVYNILSDCWADFCVWTAAQYHHHDILGGLIVHTSEVIKQCIILADFWNEKYGQTFINKPLLLSGALLHDLYKTKEISVDKFTGASNYTTEASLETHLTMCTSKIDLESYRIGLGYQTYAINEINERVPQKSDETIKFEAEAVNLLKHLILSHHGKKEWGSPIEPHTPEAHILHEMDMLSAEMYKYNKQLKQMNPGESTYTSSGSKVVMFKDSTKK